MDFLKALDKIVSHYHQNLPFALFSMADSDKVQVYLQKNDSLYVAESLSEEGMIIAPFDSRLPILEIPASDSDVFETQLIPVEINKEKVGVQEEKDAQKEHEELVDKTIEVIEGGASKKIVISRKKDFSLVNFDVKELILRLFSAQPAAYRYVWFHPETGIWCGATPEVLVNVKKNHFNTMALAGTQPFKEGVVSWRKKELEEQHFVTEAILDNLKDYVDDLEVGEVGTQRAGTLLHLKTDIEGKMKEEPGTLRKIIETMHPTPAVCGTPQDFAREFIIENENYSREFYTGFVGPVQDKGSSAFFVVNLRSMRIKDNVARLFVGGGITADSDAGEEWIETQNKMQTMLQVLQPFL